MEWSKRGVEEVGRNRLAGKTRVEFLSKGTVRGNKGSPRNGGPSRGKR